MATLNAAGAEFLQSLKENRPDLYTTLRTNGTLDAAALSRQTLYEDRVVFLIRETGMHPLEAQGEAARDFLLVPDRSQAPDLLATNLLAQEPKTPPIPD